MAQPPDSKSENIPPHAAAKEKGMPDKHDFSNGTNDEEAKKQKEQEKKNRMQRFGWRTLGCCCQLASGG